MMKFLTAVVLIGVTTSTSGPSTDNISWQVERAARDYRIFTYHTFRNDRDTYDQKQLEGRNVLAQWKRDGRLEEQGRESIQWFVDQINEFGGSAEYDEYLQPEATAEISIPLSDDPLATITSPDNSDNSNSHDQTNRDDQGNLAGDAASTKSTLATQRKPAGQNGLLRGIGSRLFAGDSSNNSAQTADQPAAELSTQNSPDDLHLVIDTRDEPNSSPVSEEITEELFQPLSADVNTDELKAQVTGYNRALAAVEQALSGDAIDSNSLSRYVGELEQLVQRQRDLKPYLSLESLSTVERAHVGNLKSPSDALVTAFQHIDDRLAESLNKGGAQSPTTLQLQGLIDRVEQLLTAPSLD